jgi:hypothetical protein
MSEMAATVWAIAIIVVTVIFMFGVLFWIGTFLGGWARYDPEKYR